MTHLQKQLLRSSSDKKWLNTKIESIKKSPDGARRWLKDLGKNDFEHAEAVEAYIDKILIESNVKLSAEEIYLILHSIYTHDIGYRINAKDHARFTFKLITKNPETYFIFDENLSKAIAFIGLAHGINDINEIPDKYPIDFLSKTEDFDLRFLGSLLLIADEMDQGYLRVFNRTGHEKSPRNNVYHVEIGPQIAKLKTKPNSFEEWEELGKISENIQKRLDTIQPVLARRKIRLEHILLYPKVWSKQITHKDISSDKSGDFYDIKQEKEHLFLLDGTVLGAEILQFVRKTSLSTVVLPIYNASFAKCPTPISPNCSSVIWILGENFEIPLSMEVVNNIIQNTFRGVGLILFPFVAWSASQGINDEVEELLPVTLKGNWHEGRRHKISNFSNHEITEGIPPFEIENTYENLRIKSSAECIISDSKKNPFLVIGSYGKGKIAYLNISSHHCIRPRAMVSPWVQSKWVKELFKRTIDWISR